MVLLLLIKIKCKVKPGKKSNDLYNKVTISTMRGIYTSKENSLLSRYRRNQLVKVIES